MTWTEYYDNITEWSAGMAVEQLCNLTQLGPSDQVADVVYSVSLEDEALATCVLDKANEFGVRFTGEDLLMLGEPLRCHPGCADDRRCHGSRTAIA